MRTVYETERATLILGDARDALQGIERESIELTITDPPYGVEWKSGRRAESFAMLANDGAGAEDRAGIREVIEQLVRITRRERHLYVFGPADILAGLKISKPVTLIWDKMLNGSGNLASPWAPNHEPINFAVNKSDKAAQAGSNPIPARLRKGAIISARRPNSKQVRHPSEKPVALLAELIESSSRAGDLVVDPFAGIGSTGVAAILRGRRALLVELDERYADLAIERLKLAELIADSMKGI